MNLDAELAMLCEAVYLPEWADVEAFIAPDWQLAVPLDVANSEAMLCRRGAEAVALVFRGTEFSRGKIADLADNLGTFSAWSGPGGIHSGYARYLRRLYQPARKAAWHIAGAPLYVTGHSLGGAVATLFAALNQFDAEPVAIERTVTFGSPRPFNTEAKKALDFPITRHVGSNDLARHWPLNPWFCHYGKPEWHECSHDIGLYRKAFGN